MLSLIINFSIVTMLMISFSSYALEELDEDCYGYHSQGSVLPLEEDKLQMIKDLSKAVESLGSPAGTLELKVNYYKKILPSIVEALSEVQEERKELFRIIADQNPSTEDLAKLAALKKRYQTDSVDELNLRINIVPIDLILVQSAIETGWGRSEASKKCNNLVGLHHGNTGLAVCDTPSKKLAKFDNPSESFRTYLISINRNSAYKELRDKRAKILKNGDTPTGKDFATFLTRYSERPAYYIKEITDFINQQNLDTIIANAVELSESCEFTPPAD